MATPLMAKKTDGRSAVIVNASDNSHLIQREEKRPKMDVFDSKPTKVLMLRNMVRPELTTPPDGEPPQPNNIYVRVGSPATLSVSFIYVRCPVIPFHRVASAPNGRLKRAASIGARSASGGTARCQRRADAGTSLSALSL
eukprot:7535786-Pyramimonas_sp.AAC.2